MEITATELKNNLGKYLQKARSEDIIITKNGALIARLTSVTSKEDQSKSYYADNENSSGKLSMLKEERFSEAYETGTADEWAVTHNGEPVARLTPIRKKRKLGFIEGPPVSQETIDALMEPVMTEEELDEWEAKEL